MSETRYLPVLFLSAMAAPHLGCIALGGIAPDLLLVVSLYPSLRHGFRAGYRLAWLGGFLLDCGTLGAGLPHCLGFLALAYGLSVARRAVDFHGQALAQALAVGAAALALDNLGVVFLRLGPGAAATALLLQAFLAALYTACVAPLVILCLDRLPLVPGKIAAENVPLGASSACPP